MENRLFYAPLPEASIIQLAHECPISTPPLSILSILIVDTDENELHLISVN